MLKNKKGFTILELIVVIAIIATLTTVVMWSISNYKAKNDDAVVKAGMKTVTNQAEIYYLNNGGSYADMCEPVLGDSVVLAALQQINFSSDDFASNGGCESDSQNWVAWAKLKGGGDTWCADGTNFSGLVVPSPSGTSCQ